MKTGVSLLDESGQRNLALLGGSDSAKQPTMHRAHQTAIPTSHESGKGQMVIRRFVELIHGVCLEFTTTSFSCNILVQVHWQMLNFITQGEKLRRSYQDQSQLTLSSECVPVSESCDKSQSPSQGSSSHILPFQSPPFQDPVAKSKLSRKRPLSAAAERMKKTPLKQAN